MVKFFYLDYPINCHEYLVSRHNTTSGTYRIDPDGKNNGVSAFDVHCEFVYEGLDRQYSAYSRIDPKSIGPKNVFLDHDVKFEMSYAVGVDYSDAKMDQIAALISSSETCEQKIQVMIYYVHIYRYETCLKNILIIPFFQFDCHLAKISQHAFWLDRNLQRQTYFTGSKSNESICECSTSKTCGFSGSGLVCNCDQMYPVAWRKDSGTITNKVKLPCTSGFSIGIDTCHLSIRLLCQFGAFYTACPKMMITTTRTRQSRSDL